MIISFYDLSKRARNRNMKNNYNKINPRIYTENNTFCYNNALYAIKHWEDLAENTNEAYNKAIDIFIEVCDNENNSNINTCMNCLIENVDKVRDASQLLNSLKYRNSRLKRKINTTIKSKYGHVNNAIINSINDIKKPTGVVSSSNSNSNTSTVEECLKNIMYEASKNKECDRILENYSKICKRFNINKIISEMNYSDDIYSAILNISSCIDSYSIPFKNKYSHMLEASYYVLNKYNMNYPSSKIIEAVTDYFIFSSVLTENELNSIIEVKNNSVLYSDDDFNSIAYLYDETEDDIFDTNNDGVFNIDDIIENYCFPIKENKIKEILNGNPDERKDEEIQEQINKFRKEVSKDPDNKNNISRLKSLINMIFTKSPYQIVNELTNIFVIIRAMAIILSAAYIHPIVGLIALITNYILKMTLSRKQLEKIVKKYQNEIDNVRSKLEKAKDDNSKEKFQKYLNELEKDYEKIKTYENNLYSDEENYERDTNTSYNNNDDDDDWGDFDIEEVASIVYIADVMQSISEGLIDDNIEGIVYKNLYKLDNDSIDALTDFSVTVPIILEKNKLCEALSDYRNELRKTQSVANYIKIDCINENINKLKKDTNVYAISNNLSGIRCYLDCINEIINMSIPEEYITEMNFINTLKLAVDRLKKTAMNLKDKEKQISNSIDVSVNNISKGMEDAMANDNREAIIKGKLLPSASKCIKIACTLGIAWAINPVISIIAAIGAFATNQALKAKERQLIIDDIDIELKMVERYLRQAEDEGDLKKVRNLEMVKRNLLRQQQRIKYKMKVVYKQNVPNVNNNND